MIPNLLAAYSFLSAVTAKDNIEGVVPMLGKTIERMTGLAIGGMDMNGDGFPDRLTVKWTGGPTIARGIGDYMNNLFSNPDTFLTLLAAVAPSYIRSVWPLSSPSEVNSVLSVIEAAGSKSFKAVVAGTIWDPPVYGADLPAMQSPETPYNAVRHMRPASATPWNRRAAGQAYAVGTERPAPPNEFFRRGM